MPVARLYLELRRLRRKGRTECPPRGDITVSSKAGTNMKKSLAFLTLMRLILGLTSTSWAQSSSTDAGSSTSSSSGTITITMPLVPMRRKLTSNKPFQRIDEMDWPRQSPGPLFCARRLAEYRSRHSGSAVVPSVAARSGTWLKDRVGKDASLRSGPDEFSDLVAAVSRQNMIYASFRREIPAAFGGNRTLSRIYEYTA
jgi:hypothetical protein